MRSRSVWPSVADTKSRVSQPYFGESEMKKSLFALGVLGTFAGAANAQSSVTLYGLIDAGITYTNNQGGAKNVQATSGAVNGSRWGLRGAEDLGGGLKAIF